MEKYGMILDELIKNKVLSGTLSNPRKKEQWEKRVQIRQIFLKGEKIYQLEFFVKEKVFHKNVKEEQLKQEIQRELTEHFKQFNGTTERFSFQLKLSKKGVPLYTKQEQNTKKSPSPQEHNREKNYLLKEYGPILPLIDLGIMTKTGEIVKGQMDKFVQINKFIEQIHWLLKEEEKKCFRIVDFGCGKSYLSFIVYDYFCNMQKIPIEMVGLDLKEDVIQRCNGIAKKYGYEQLTFQVGDAEKFEENQPVDMVLSLHACDTATDYALHYGIVKKAKWILSVPCCQKEIQKQWKGTPKQGVLSYGLIRERYAGLLTDTIRGKLLESVGYQVDLLEFVDLENSPKNILLRCSYGGKYRPEKRKEVEALLQEYGISQTLYERMKG